jgi:predicted RecB family endonuclease
VLISSKSNSVLPIKKTIAMRKQVRIILPLLMMVLFVSCSDMSKKVEDQLNDLTNKAVRLDSLVNEELDKVMALDSIINVEGTKVKELDSLINKSASRIDSIAKSKIRSLK